MEQGEATPRQSGIPRLSRLPVLSKRSSQLLQAPNLDAADRTPGQTSSRLSKRSSIASLPRQNEQPGRAPPNNLRSSVSGRPPQAVTAPRLNTRHGSSRSIASSRVSQATSSTSWSPVDGDEGDKLSSLGTFRSASRQGQSFEDDSPIENERKTLPVNKPRTSRPSLSDRAIESIQAVPATPKDRRHSNFFSPVDSPMAPPPRPSSVLSSRSDRINSDDTNRSSRTTAQTTSRFSMSARPVSKTSNGSLGSLRAGAVQSGPATTLSARLQSARESAKQPSRPASPKKAPSTSSKSATSGKPQSVLHQGSQSSSNGMKGIPSSESASSSATLKQQIAAARAAARKDRGQAGPGAVQTEGRLAEHGSDEDPFNQAPRDDKHIMRNRIKTARMDGKLNISALGLKSIPDEVTSMYSAASVQESNTSWAEMVDLTKFIAADNEFDAIDDAVFPDLTQEELMLEEHAQSAQFGGVEFIDFHGNALTTVPRGIRRLEHLTSLNLTHNKIENAALDIIAQVKTLKELRLGHNSISGSLPSALCGLSTLEVLDVQANRLLALPEAIQDLVSLRVLNVSGNQLTAIPMDALAQLPLQELDASSNALIASLFPLGGSSQHRSLRTLNVANNSLAALTFSPELNLTEIRAIDITNNHLAVLPSMKGWLKLHTLTAGDNKISELPDGFTSLRNLRIANLSGNDLHVLPAEVAMMESLTTLVLASNPLRHKKYLTMDAADIKQDLRSILGHRNESGADEYDDELASWGTAPEDPAYGTSWAIKNGGVLDLSGKGLSDAVNDSLGSFLRTNEVRQLKLGNNKLTAVPPALWLAHDLRSLDLSNNPLDTDYLSDELNLPMLSDVNLSNCRITAIEPLLQHLRAAELQSLQMNVNRMTGAVPQLRQAYPRLTTLLASDNKFTSVSADALLGFTTVDLSSNDLQSLPAEIGLLWDEGLKSFKVGRNAFRVPGHRVLEKGTQATMRWLKDRIKVDTVTAEQSVD